MAARLVPLSNVCVLLREVNNKPPNAINANCALSALLVLQEYFHPLQLYSRGYRARLAIPPQSLLPSPPLACRAPDREGHTKTHLCSTI
jgi:hypothetical protein